MADTLENTGKYLEEKISGIASDVTALIKRNLIPALFVGTASASCWPGRWFAKLVQGSLPSHGERSAYGTRSQRHFAAVGI